MEASQKGKFLCLHSEYIRPNIGLERLLNMFKALIELFNVLDILFQTC